ncbi:MAG: sigma-54 dependent transcriptional regulator [Puniceicoccales bacterium]|jgi:DNA-binding NtrC family response regulator|nr:sigma-54 dependent transcriptional regulator [Puniceicoccales bacterium]
MRLPSLLIVDDEKNTRDGLNAALEVDYDIFLARDADEAIRLLDNERFDLVLTDLRMAGKSGLSVIDKTLSLPPDTRPICIMMTAYGNVETAVEAMRRGAYDFLPKPLNLEKLETVLLGAIQKQKVVSENPDPQATHATPTAPKKFKAPGIVGSSAALTRVMAQARQVAPSRATVLLLGETGTGKELFARMVHNNSPRASAPFVATHCAALTATLLESELFGYEKGAFTGAVERRIGRFEAANGGTLFLDEIGEIDALTQIKLLRFLETRTLERLGSNKPIEVDTRLVCATNKNLLDAVAKGSFREDLFYRLSVVQINLPALRQRATDIPALLTHYLAHFSHENNLPPPTLTPSAQQLLVNYAWPGNIRELRNLCENLVVMHSGASLGEYDLDPRFHAQPTGSEIPDTLSPAKPEKKTSTPESNTLSQVQNEKRLLRQALLETKGNRTQAAELLGISRRTIHRKLIAWPELDV